MGSTPPPYNNQPRKIVPVTPATLAPLIAGPARGWSGSPPTNQRKNRKNRRRAHANGQRKAFAR